MSKEDFDYSEQYKNFYEAWEKTMTEAMDIWRDNPLFSEEAGEGADMAQHYKKFYETWESSSSEIMEKWVNSPLFASNIGKALQKSSELKKYFDDAVEKTLKNMNFPSKNDVDRVLSSINNLEAKLNDLSDKIDDMNQPRRTTRATKK